MKQEKNIKKGAAVLVALCLVLAMTGLLAGAGTGNIASSTIGQGLKRLVDDLSTYLLIIGVPALGMVAVFFMIKMGMASEEGGKQQNKKYAFMAGGCAVGIALVGGVIKLVSSYFV